MRCVIPAGQVAFFFLESEHFAYGHAGIPPVLTFSKNSVQEGPFSADEVCKIRLSHVNWSVSATNSRTIRNCRGVINEIVELLSDALRLLSPVSP